MRYVPRAAISKDEVGARDVVTLPALLPFARLCVGVVYASFGLSIDCNIVGITLAARGLFSLLISAILMPASSVTVVAFACGATT